MAARIPTPYTLHPTPYTLHPTPYTLHPTPYTPSGIRASRMQTCDMCREHLLADADATGPDALKALTQWPTTSMSLIKFLAGLEDMAEGEGGGGMGAGGDNDDGEGLGEEACDLGAAPLAVAIASAATQELVFHDTHLSVPLGEHRRTRIRKWNGGSEGSGGVRRCRT